MTTSNTDITAGSGTHVATFAISEDAISKQVQRVGLSDSAGAEALGVLGATPAQYSLLDRIRSTGRLLVAAGSTLTRPANVTAYSANDSISDNATAGSVTALSVTFSGYNDDPVTVERIRIATTDTGLQGAQVAVYVYNSDPTASSGVGGGDNAAFSNKQAGFVGRLTGSFTTFSDGAVAVLVPDAGSRIITKPGAGAKTLWFQFQTLSAFTPSANSTTLIATFEGFQGIA